MTIWQEPCEVTHMLNFLVIKVVISYNAILGRTDINAFQAVASTYHLKIKFPTKNGVGMEKGDQKLARSCYVAALRADGIGGASIPHRRHGCQGRWRKAGKPVEDLILIPLDPEDPKNVTYIGASLKGPLKEKLVKFLQENNDVFSWTTADMPRIDPQLITHKLNVDPLRKSIK